MLQAYPWHGDYYDVAWGVPVAMVVPPTAEKQAHLGWGVGATRVTPIEHQFGAAIRVRASPAGRSIPPRLGLAAPINLATIIFAVPGNPSRLATFPAPCLAGQSDHRAVLFLVSDERY